MKYEVIDNFLPQDQFDNLKKSAVLICYGIE